MRRLVPAALALAIVLVAAFAVWRLAPRLLPGLGAGAPPAATLPELPPVATGWNGAAAAARALVGHPAVVLLFSDTDPGARPALAAMQAWQSAYAPLGVRVLAVRVPEYAATADSAVGGRLVRRERLVLPVADDPAGAIAAAFGGPAEGPHLVVADARGAIRVDTVGALAPVDAALRAWARGALDPAALPPPLAPSRTVRLGAGEVREGPLARLPAGHEEVFTAEFRYQQQGRPFVPFPVGGWRVGADGLAATRGGAANFLAIRYSASRVGVVVSPPPGARSRLWILLDDHWPSPDRRGEDVAAGPDGAAYVDVAGPGLYWIERGRGDAVLKLSPDSRGTTVHALVFEDAKD